MEDLHKKSNWHLVKHYKRIAGNYLRIFHAAPVSLAVFRSDDRRVMEVNRQFCADFHLPVEDLPEDQDPADSQSRALATIDPSAYDHLKARVTKGGYIQIEMQDDCQFFLKADVAPLRYDGHKCWLAATTRVPAAAQRAHFDPNDRNDYRTLVENLNDVLYTTDENAVITYVSPNIQQISGYDPNEVIGRKFTDFVHPADLPDRTNQFSSAMSGDGRATEYRLSTKGNGIKWIRTHAKPITRNGRTVGVQGILVDISDRKEMELALRCSEEKYRLVVEHCKDAICVIQDGRIKFMNPNAMALFCDADKPAMNSLFEDLIHPDDRHMILRLRHQGLEAEEIREPVTFRLIQPSGETRDVELNDAPILWEGRAAIISFLRDITRQRRMECQLRNSQKMEAMGTLASGIAHNFNNLLMGVQGNATLALANLASPSLAVQNIKGIEKLVQNGATLTKQLLNYAGGKNWAIENIDLNQLIKDVCQTLSASNKSIHIIQKLSDGLPRITADPGQMHQVLVNLLLNAADAMPDGGDVFVETTCTEGPGSKTAGSAMSARPHILLKISDTGRGIPEEILGRIFEPFFTTKGLGKGTGLGLSTAYGIIKSHNGELSVASELKKGTTFSIWLPTADDPPTAAGPGNDPESACMRGTLLLIDDDIMVIEPVSELLEQFGYTVLTALSGTDALKIYREQWKNIDLVILDLVLPDTNGGDLYQELRKYNSQIKGLIASGMGASSSARALLESGCLDFIQKPYDVGRLCKKIAKILSMP